MKTIWMLSPSFLFASSTHSQLLKKSGKELESDARWKVRMKADQKMDHALDSIASQAKKITGKKKSTNDQKPQDNQQNKSSGKQNTSSKSEVGSSIERLVNYTLTGKKRKLTPM